MACHCHGKKGESVLIAKPFDQCTACARKHVKNAWSKWNEFTYEDENRDYVSAQLRDAADHLKIEHRDTALKCRDLAIIIEENKDMENGCVQNRMNELLTETRMLFYQDHPDAEKRLDLIKMKGKSCRT